MATKPGYASRRAFLKAIPAAVAVPVAAPRAAAALDPAAQAPAGGGLTVDTLAAAQRVAAVALPPAELEQARTLVQRNLANIDAVRAVPLAATVEPAFRFDPRPVRAVRARRSSGRRATPASRASTTRIGARPTSIESLALASIDELGARLRARHVTSVQLTRMYLDRLTRANETLACVVTLTESLALAQAAQADADLTAGIDRGPLHGLPYGIKDLFATKGIRTTWGAQPYANQVFDYDATAVTRMREAGAVLVAKLTTGELAVGDLWFGGKTRNPWKPETGASGSSAGPAASVAAGLVAFAIGTETNGSIISPASTCGAVGLRPTYGRCSRYGCMTLRWTLDKVGVIARSVSDTGTVLAALHGPDGLDPTVTDAPFVWDRGATVKGLRLGIIEREFASGSAAQQAHYQAALDAWRRAGATLVPVTLPDLPASALYALMNAEAGAMFDELVRSGAINEMADKTANGRANQLRAARFIPAVDYIRAQRVRTLLVTQMNALFEGPSRVDAVLAPSSSGSVTAANVTGHPAITVPAGLDGGLPVGVMVTGPHDQEARVLQVAAAFETARGPWAAPPAYRVTG